MIRLSQRGWNNVIIFTTLILILLFNFSSDFLNRGLDDKTTVTALIPTDWVITTIEYQQNTIERIGQGWRAKSGNVSHDDLVQLVSYWHSAQIEQFDSALKWPSNNQIVTIWFAGRDKPIEYAFVSYADKTLVQIEQQTYLLIHPDFSLLNVDK